MSEPPTITGMPNDPPTTGREMFDPFAGGCFPATPLSPRVVPSVARRSERGAVIVETALALPLLLATLLAGCWTVAAIVTDLRCIDTARDVARAVARGESLAEARTIGRRQAPHNATIDIIHKDDTIHVTVRSSLAPSLLPTLHLTAKSTLQAEPGHTPTP